jgi:hypothetical protein
MAISKLCVSYLDMTPPQTSVPESVHLKLNHQDKQIFTISTPDEIQSNPEQYGMIDIYDIENRWRRVVAYNWKRLNKKLLTYKLPADKDVQEEDFEHLSDDSLMNIIRTQGNLQISH